MLKYVGMLLSLNGLITMIRTADYSVFYNKLNSLPVSEKLDLE